MSICHYRRLNCSRFNNKNTMHWLEAAKYKYLSLPGSLWRKTLHLRHLWEDSSHQIQLQQPSEDPHYQVRPFIHSFVNLI